LSGCNGYDYIFEPRLDGPNKNKYDELYVEDNIKIVICGKSLMYLLGTKIDYRNNIMESSFIYKNPNADSTCGCGTSFNIK
jgi:iron-sulfur cluster assembly accessory protein